MKYITSCSIAIQSAHSPVIAKHPAVFQWKTQFHSVHSGPCRCWGFRLAHRGLFFVICSLFFFTSGSDFRRLNAVGTPIFVPRSRPCCQNAESKGKSSRGSVPPFRSFILGALHVNMFPKTLPSIPPSVFRTFDPVRQHAFNLYSPTIWRGCLARIVNSTTAAAFS